MRWQKCISYKPVIERSTLEWPTRPSEGDTNTIANGEPQVRWIEIRPAFEAEGSLDLLGLQFFTGFGKREQNLSLALALKSVGHLWSLNEDAQLPSSRMRKLSQSGWANLGRD